MDLAFFLWPLEFWWIKKALQEKVMVTGFPRIVIPSQICDKCAGKETCSQLSKWKSWRAIDALDPNKPNSKWRQNVSHYFTNDFSRKICLLFA